VATQTSEIELKLLNSVLKNKDLATVLPTVVDPILKESSKYESDYEDVWTFVFGFYKKYRKEPEFDQVTEKFSFVKQIDTGDVSEYYADMLKQAHVKRRTGQIMAGASEELKNKNPEYVLAMVQKKLIELNRYTNNTADLNIADVDDAADHYEAVRAMAGEDGTPGIPTGIDFIDAALPTGLAAGKFIVLLGYPSRGKSWFAGLLAAQAHRLGHRPLYISMEMGAPEVRDRMYTTIGQGLLNASDLARGEISEEKLRTFGKEYLDAKPDFFIVPGGESAMKFSSIDIQAKIDQYKPSILFIDYMQMVYDADESSDLTTRMRQLSDELKKLSMINKIPVVAISSITPDKAMDPNSPPTFEMVANSKAIWFYADLGIAVHNHPENGLTELVCRKNRAGEMFAGNLQWDYGTGEWKVDYALPV